MGGNNNNQPLVWGLAGLRRDRGPHIPLHIPPPPSVGQRPTLMMGSYPHPNPNPDLQLMLWPPTMPPLRGMLVDAQSLSKSNPFLPPPDKNGNTNNKNDPIEKAAGDDSVFTIRHRKVRISDRSSIYALCRSWLRNGLPEESQPQYGDAMHSLPKPLPMPIPSSPKRDERDDESELKEDQDENTAGTLDTQELLQGHIKRAKRIRARLREDRLQRIARYEGRLDLLLRPQVEQFRNDVNASLPAG